MEPKIGKIRFTMESTFEHHPHRLISRTSVMLFQGTPEECVSVIAALDAARKTYPGFTYSMEDADERICTKEDCLVLIASQITDHERDMS